MPTAQVGDHDIQLQSVCYEPERFTSALRGDRYISKRVKHSTSALENGRVIINDKDFQLPRQRPVTDGDNRLHFWYGRGCCSPRHKNLHRSPPPDARLNATPPFDCWRNQRSAPVPAPEPLPISSVVKNGSNTRGSTSSSIPRPINAKPSRPEDPPGWLLERVIKNDQGVPVRLGRIF
jgi:hypothetical protein